MKKIILIMLLLSFVILSNAMSKKNENLPQQTKTTSSIKKTMTDIDKEVYMPKKLIYSELPDDYPKELDELFRFYYDFTTRIYNEYQKIKKQKLKDEIEGGTKISIFRDNYINLLSMKKTYRLFYLDNLAKQSISNYYLEYIWIIEKLKIRDKIFLRDYYPKLNPSFFVKIILKEDKPFYLKSPHFIIGRIALKIEKEIPEISVLRNRTWVKAKVIFNEKIVKKNRPQIDSLLLDYQYYSKIKILDSPLGIPFEKKKLLINATVFNHTFKEQPKLEEKHTYLIPLKFFYGGRIYEKVKLSNGIIIDNNRMYLNAGLVECFDVNKAGYCSPRGTTSVFTRDVMSLFGNPFKYNDFKKRMSEIMKTIKIRGGIK